MSTQSSRKETPWYEETDSYAPFCSWTQKCIIVNEGANAEKFEATTPTQTIPAKGGDSVVLDWQQWPDSHIGGQAVYMAVSPDQASIDGKPLIMDYDSWTGLRRYLRRRGCRIAFLVQDHRGKL